MIHDTSNTPLSDFEFQMKKMKQQYEEAKRYYNQRKNRVSMMLDTWLRNRDYDVKCVTKLEKVLWEKLNIGTSVNVILEQIDKEKSAQASGSLDEETKFQGIAQCLAD